MNQIKTTRLLELADADLKRATQELYRPIEDVVSFSACVFSRSALYRYLQGLAILYADEKNEALEDDQTIEQLITYCSQYSNRLQDIDFSSLQCKCDEILKDDEEELVHCTSVDRLNYCSNLAAEVREILIERLG